MSSFRKFGGINHSATNNIVRSNISNSNHQYVMSFSGQQNSKQKYQSHIDLSGNSILHTGSIYFQDGSILSSGNASSMMGPQGPIGVGVTGPQGGFGIGVTGPQGSIGVGVTGPQGGFGIGVTGPQGATGPIGVGVTGPQGGFGIGVTGPQGATGPIGVGVTGPQGGIGIGVTGPQGSIGVGVTGPQGFQGESGADGSWFNSTVSPGSIYSLSNVAIGSNTDQENISSALIVNGDINSTGSLSVNGTITAGSDYRIKKDVKILSLIDYNLDGLNPVIFKFKHSNQTNIGLIAHEVEEHFPFFVEGEKDGSNIQTVNYCGFIGLLIKEIQELKKRIKLLENEKLT
jgi:hypothetical protein